MNATPSAALPVTRVPSSVRAWARELGESAKPVQTVASCDAFGLVVKSARSLDEHVELLLNVGWTATSKHLSCPECTAGVVRRVCIGSKGDRYVLRHVGGAWRCSCPGYSYRGRCTHAATLEAETAERQRLMPLARDFLTEIDPGAMVFPAHFLAWLGREARDVTVEGCRLVLASVLEDYRHGCRDCGGEGGEAHHAGGWEEPSVDGQRCARCEGEGELDPPRLAPLEADVAIAAE